MATSATSSLAATGASSVTEMAKCEIVCANCHAIRTFRRREEARQSRANKSSSISEAGSSYVIHQGVRAAVFVTAVARHTGPRVAGPHIVT